jgi:tetratricopeptide (TPR) repeat protein
MGIIKNLFGKKPESAKQETPRAGEPVNDPKMIKVYDKFGRELLITREQWLENVLKGTLESNWNKPDELYGNIVNSLNDGFIHEMLAPAEQLFKIDPQRVRAACIYGIVLMENGRLEQAEEVLRSHMREHGEDGVVLTNLAKVFFKRNDPREGESILWRGLELDPNQDNGLGWYEAIHRERGGEAAGLEALHRISKLPGSWRAQLWLARVELKNGKLPRALSLYKEALSRAGDQPPTDMLMQISGDLGNQGNLAELLQLVEPLFVIEIHGLHVGNNLIKAHLQLGHFERAKEILDRLYALQRPDWKETLSYWDTEIGKARISDGTVKDTPKISFLRGEGPVWLKPSSPLAQLFADAKRESSVVCFIGASAEKPEKVETIQRQMADSAGRMSRALPLFLAEQTEFRGGTRTQTIVPWITSGEGGGFVLSGLPWEDDQLLEFCRQGEVKSDYIVVTHLKVNSDDCQAELRLIRVQDGKRLGKLDASFSFTNPATAVVQLGRQLLDLLAEAAKTKLHSAPLLYQLPEIPHFSDYLLRLEQLLAVRCGSMDNVGKNFLSGERDIIDGNLNLCLRLPRNPTTRIVLVETLAAMHKIRPEVVREYADKVALLQTEMPLKEPLHSKLQAMLADIGIAAS